MKKWVLLSSVIIFVLTLKVLDSADVPGARPVVGRATLPFNVARLYAREPDTELSMPVEGARVGGVSDTWHAERPDGRRHEGQDIFARRGTPVRSATEGYVVRVGESPLGGKTVFVMGAGGRAYYYAHLDRHAEDLAAGAYVTTETVLGYVGTTGNATGTPPHLHFGVYTPEGALNPLPILKDRG
ncbi:MAG TPA: M23 family metallopeptidase [Pyrinomonadaceae bacterium]|nr:M23 family metallopeptidase [Pyrinomonadaceae bacterium]